MVEFAVEGGNWQLANLLQVHRYVCRCVCVSVFPYVPKREHAYSDVCVCLKYPYMSLTAISIYPLWILALYYMCKCMSMCTQARACVCRCICPPKISLHVPDYYFNSPSMDSRPLLHLPYLVYISRHWEYWNIWNITTFTVSEILVSVPRIFTYFT